MALGVARAFACVFLLGSLREGGAVEVGPVDLKRKEGGGGGAGAGTGIAKGTCEQLSQLPLTNYLLVRARP